MILILFILFLEWQQMSLEKNKDIKMGLMKIRVCEFFVGMAEV